MKLKKPWGVTIAGAAAGFVNGLFGAGGGMLLVPLLQLLTDAKEDQVFPASVSIIMPICIVSLSVRALQSPLPIADALPYLLGGILGGLAAGLTDGKIPTKWLHRALGALIIWGGLQYLWSIPSL